MALSFPNRNEPVLACGRSRRAFVKTLTPDPRMEGGTDPHRLPAVAAGGGFVQETPHSLLHGAISHRKGTEAIRCIGRRAAQRRRRRRRSERPFLVVKAVALPFEARAPAGASPAFLYLLTDKARPEPFDPVRRLGFCAVGAW
ncbi:hypothetical protein MTO96_013709 [Rhipicephalus appendiculatus]